MHKFMRVMPGDHRRRALLGPDEIDQKERENSGECCPRENFGDRDWDRDWPGCRSMDNAVHVLPYGVSALRAPLGKGQRTVSTARMRESRNLGAAVLSVNAARAWAEVACK